ncbi:MAG: TonB-dependent receptor, partial [Halieaceae bacterium]|jgi:iron complex outermembrane receptor protein|nr:TonB-dependent receptor [Halieaceae bacterium]
VVNPSPVLDSIFGSGTTITEANNDSIAAYAQIDYELTDTLTATGGLRYTKDNRELQIDSLAGATGSVLGLGNFDESYDEVTYTAVLAWRPNADTTTYAKISTGYVSGGILSGIPYDPETLTAYELGFKSQFLENRLRINMAAFYNEYKDLQIQAFLNGRQFFDNAGEATIQGVEAELQWLPTEGLMLTASLGYVDHEFDEYLQRTPDGGFRDLTNDVVQQFVPDTTGRLSAQYYTGAFSGGAQFFARIDGLYQGDTPLTGNTLRDTAGNPTPLNSERDLDAFWNVSARVGFSGIRVGDSQMSVSLFGENLLDEDFFPFSTEAFSLNRMYARGRIYSLEVSLEI